MYYYKNSYDAAVDFIAGHNPAALKDPIFGGPRGETPRQWARNALDSLIGMLVDTNEAQVVRTAGFTVTCYGDEINIAVDAGVGYKLSVFDMVQVEPKRGKTTAAELLA